VREPSGDLDGVAADHGDAASAFGHGGQDLPPGQEEKSRRAVMVPSSVAKLLLGLDVALVAGLAAAGASSPLAVGAVLGYRMITVWVPLVPAACMFAVLLRRRII
jgi:hypothetical protein